MGGHVTNGSWNKWDYCLFFHLINTLLQQFRLWYHRKAAVCLIHCIVSVSACKTMITLTWTGFSLFVRELTYFLPALLKKTSWYCFYPSAGNPSWKFKIIAATQYTGSGEIKVLDNPLCSTLYCAMRCLIISAECKVAALNKLKCKCHLYNKDFYTNTNNNIADTKWDLLTSHYYNTQ